METGFGILLGIALIGWIIALVDWRARRKDRQSGGRAS
jgi:hypothetical protein